ncbi:prepilin-type N-terminal cleavage/methylation domain-containing protein [bacterium]|nr:prepilin-type N-terminal cleavage/methylation domain-containing protein [bacterium]
MTHSNAFKTMTPYPRKKIPPSILRINRGLTGFTLIETMVAGLIMSITLVAVSRLSISAISTSSHQTIRRKIEAAINNDIQLLQQADSRLKLVNITDKESACTDPGSFLMKKLSSKSSDYYVPEPKITDPSGKRVLKRTMTSSQTPIMTQIIYTITAPEKTIQTERRILNLYPNFHYLCDVL